MQIKIKKLGGWGEGLDAVYLYDVDGAYTVYRRGAFPDEKFLVAFTTLEEAESFLRDLDCDIPDPIWDDLKDEYDVFAEIP